MASDPFVLVAAAAGLAALAMTVALSVQIVVMRYRTAARERRRDALFATWRHVRTY